MKVNPRFQKKITAGKTDHRYLPRWETDESVYYRIEGELGSRLGHMKNISCAGASLSIDRIIKPHKVVKLRINFNDGSPVIVDGTVLWIKNTKGGMQIGIKFHSMSNKTQETILSQAFELNKEKLLKHWYKGWEGQRL